MPAPAHIGEAYRAHDTRATSPRPWDGLRDPYVYTAYSEVRSGAQTTDWVAEPVGFRSFAVDANQGFSLNGHYLDLHGVNRHQDRIDLGWAITNREHDEDMALIQELGATGVRLAHYEHAAHFYDLCDRKGMVAWATTVKVYANTASVELFLNGTSLGAKTSADHIFIWPVTLRAGANAVEVMGTTGSMSVADAVMWTLM